MHIYHYDKTDAEHHRKLADTVPELREFNEASLDERWVHPEPGAMLDLLMISFHRRFPLVIEDLLAFSDGKTILVEGFGILPELVQPLLSSPHQAVWLIPTEKFKGESMARRGKPSFGNKTSDPDKAKMNLYGRDVMLAEYYRRQVPVYGYDLHEVDGTRSIDEMTDLVDRHFARYHGYLK